MMMKGWEGGAGMIAVIFGVFGENQIFMVCLVFFLVCLFICLFTPGWKFASACPTRPGAERRSGSPVRNHIVFYLKQTLASSRPAPPTASDSLACVCLCNRIHRGFVFTRLRLGVSGGGDGNAGLWAVHQRVSLPHRVAQSKSYL